MIVRQSLRFTAMVSSLLTTVMADDGGDRLKQAIELHRSFLTLDSHMDTPAVMQRPDFDISERHSWENDLSQVDFPRLTEGGMDGGFLVVFVPQGARTPEGRAEAVKLASSRFDTIESMLKRQSGLAGLARSLGEAEYLRRQGKFVFFVGIENGHAIGNDLDVLREFHRRGARYFGITHMLNNDLADASTDPEGEEHGGLSHFGRAAVELCNRLGMMVDVSHASDKVAEEVLVMSKAPVIASHSSAHALFAHPRNLNDDLIRGIAKSGGVVQINLFSAYLMEVAPDPERKAAIDAWRARYRDRWNELDDSEKTESVRVRVEIEQRYPVPLATVATAVDHIDHVVGLVGIDHAGISADFDGGGGVEKVMDISGMPRVTAELLQRGYTAVDLEKLWGGNLMRVLGQTQRVASRLEMKHAPARMIPFDTPEGRVLLDEESAIDHAPLAANWVAQLKSHCGAASAVVVQNSLIPGGGFTQDNLFDERTADIIQQETVYQIGFTLEELARTIHARSGLAVDRFHAGNGPDEHGYEKWIEALKANRLDAGRRIIVNYATGWPARRSNSGGHFSPIADYHEGENLVLIQEINASRSSFWCDARELWDSMNQVDGVSDRVRGWLEVRKSDTDSPSAR